MIRFGSANMPRYVVDPKGNRGAERFLSDEMRVDPQVEWVSPRGLVEDDQDSPRDATRLASVKAALRSGTPLPALLVYEGDRMIWDGHHRWQAALDLGLDTVPVQWVVYR